MHGAAGPARAHDVRGRVRPSTSRARFPRAPSVTSRRADRGDPRVSECDRAPLQVDRRVLSSARRGGVVRLHSTWDLMPGWPVGRAARWSSVRDSQPRPRVGGVGTVRRTPRPWQRTRGRFHRPAGLVGPAGRWTIPAIEGAARGEGGRGPTFPRSGVGDTPAAPDCRGPRCGAILLKCSSRPTSHS